MSNVESVKEPTDRELLVALLSVVKELSEKIDDLADKCDQFSETLGDVYEAIQDTRILE